jgi:hypothetical protein
MEWLMLSKRQSIEANRAKPIDRHIGGLPSSVRRPLRLHFEPPVDPSAWHMTGRINWPCPHESYEMVPICEWANDKGMRIWLSAQHQELVAEFTDPAKGGWRELAVRSQKLLAGVVQRSCDSFYCITLCLQLTADLSG